MIKIVQGSKIEKLLFVLLFFLVVIFLNYPSLFLLKPQSFHIIRQTDTLSFINYYVKTGFNFFNIGNLNLYNNSGKTACEFPIFYYLVALLSLTGIKAYLLLKSIYIAIFFFTSFLLFKFLRKTFPLIDSFAITVLLFSSTVILYYTLNYIPNYPALCFTISALVNFLNYLETNNSRNFIFSILFFVIAGLLKVTFAIYPIGCFLYLLFKFLKLKNNNYKVVLAYFLIFLLMFLWNLYVVYYNKINNADYYLTSIKPLWNGSYSEKKEVFSFIFNYWLYKYYYHSTIHVFFIVIVASAFFYKKINMKQLYLSIIFLLGMTSYFILFFKQFRDHDYYFLEFVPFFLIVFINSYNSIIKSVGAKTKIVLSISILILSFLSINYGKLNVNRRYDKPFEKVSKIAYVLENVEEKLDSIGVSKKAKILVIPDYTMNASLYYLNRFGYTIGDTMNLNLSKYYEKSDYILIADSSLIKSMAQKFRLEKCQLAYRGAALFKIIH